MKVKITSSGDIRGTKVEDLDTGADLTSMVSEVRFHHVAGEQPKAELFVNFVEIESSGIALLRGQKDGWATLRVVRSITFADGETMDFSQGKDS
ncbi:hypothetical protein [Roseibium sp. Sym1]|uniref:hypothetical protein n=1 Tax=Roseibium sp. Sym1 TaxID=3016006 RepID=UPI0022B317F9|nr:hypothetical protein [Roseibium sp. Sym1]